MPDSEVPPRSIINQPAEVEGIVVGAVVVSLADRLAELAVSIVLWRVVVGGIVLWPVVVCGCAVWAVVVGVVVAL